VYDRRVIHPLRLRAAALLLASASLVQAAAPSYTVRPGDTLYALARARGTDTATLLALNHLDSSTLRVGQRLQLPDPRSGAAAAPSLPRPSRSDATPRVTPTALRASSAAQPPLPQLSDGPVRGPVAWAARPAATVASFIGWLPPAATSPFGDVLPIRTFLDGLTFERQTYNNCGPSALSSVLGFYKVRIDQDVIQRTTRQDGGYMQVSAIAPELARYGLRTTTLRNGKLSQVKRLLALGIPVIVLQWYDRPGHIDHFRVVRGYDDVAGLVWVSDSMVGPVSYLSYADFDALWNTQGRKMFPVYPAGYDRQVQALI